MIYTLKSDLIYFITKVLSNTEDFSWVFKRAYVSTSFK